MKSDELFHVNGDSFLEYFDIINLANITEEVNLKCYALRVKGNLMLPFHKDGDILIVERNSQNKIRHGDKVVYHQPKGSCVRVLELSDDIVRVRPLNLTHYQETELVPGLDNLDKIIFIISS
jgi:phage repressor protein C with HTH and peptisase S24 domain